MAGLGVQGPPEAFCNVPLEEVAGRIGEPDRPSTARRSSSPTTTRAPTSTRTTCTPAGPAQAAATATGIPAKVYLSTMRGSSWRKIWEALRAARRGGAATGQETRNAPAARLSPRSGSRPRSTSARCSTRKREALFAHGSQINGDSWFSKIPPEVAEEAFGYEYFIRVADTTGAPLPEDRPVRGAANRGMTGRWRTGPASRAATSTRRRDPVPPRRPGSRRRRAAADPDEFTERRKALAATRRGPRDRRSGRGRSPRCASRPARPGWSTGWSGPTRARRPGSPTSPAALRDAEQAKDGPPAARAVRGARPADRCAHRPGARRRGRA